MQRSYLAGFIGVIVVALILAVLLNYFHIISFSSLFPKQFNLSPQKYSNQNGSQSQFSCPLDLDPCPKAEVITTALDDANFKGLGYKKLAPGVNVLAIISGQYQIKEVESTSSASKNDQGLVNIDIQNQNLKVSYHIAGKVGDLPPNGEVSQDQIIAVLSGGQRGQVRFGKLYNLDISIKGLKSGQFLKLTPSKDGIFIGE